MSAPTPDEILDAAGITADALAGGDWPLESVMSTVRRLRELLVGGDSLVRELCRDGAIRRLKAVVDSPARIVDAALQETAAEDSGVELENCETYGNGIVDIVTDGSALGWLVADDGGVRIDEEHMGREPWPRAAIPWPAIPAFEDVKAALEAGGRSPFEELVELYQNRVILPEPAKEWASLLAAWTLGTYMLDSFSYYPLLLFEGPAERGKTRAAKAILWPSHRGMYTPSPSSATIFRDRARHRVAILLDVEDLPNLLKRGGDIGDLILNSFERDGVIRRCTRPDAPPERQVETFAAYGPTILVSNRQIRDSSPLASRCLRVVMPEAGRRLVPDALRPHEARLIRARALAWAAQMQADGLQLPEVEVSLRGRARDLALPLLRVLASVAPDELEPVLKLLADVDADRRAEAGRSWEARVALALPEARGDVEAGRLYIAALVKLVNDGQPETDHLTPQQVGTARRALGLRGGSGGHRKIAYLEWPGDEIVDALAERYATGHPHPPASPAVRIKTSDSAQVTQEGRGRPPAQVTRPENPATTRDTGDAGDAGDPPDPFSDEGPRTSESDDPKGDDDDGEDGELPFERMKWRGPDGDGDDDEWQRRGPRRPAPVANDGGAAADPPGVDL